MPKRKRTTNNELSARPHPTQEASIRPGEPKAPASLQDRRTVSYATDSDDEPPKRAQLSHATSRIPEHAQDVQDATPAGPYSYTKEKRLEMGKKDLSKARPRSDATFGQMSAFPELDMEGDEEFYGPADDGLGYLRMVRSEAKGLARVVTAPALDTTSQGDDGYGSTDVNEIEDEDVESAGYYSDGAYVARPPNTADEEAASITAAQSPQARYHDALCRRFQAHSARMRTEPAAAAIAALDERHPISCPPHNNLAVREWKYFLREVDPLPAQLASMDTATVMRLLGILKGSLQIHMTARENLSKRYSTWIWGLLGRLDTDSLHTTEVGAVRDLANMAIWAQGVYEKTKCLEEISDLSSISHSEEEEEEEDPYENSSDEGEIVDEQGDIDETAALQAAKDRLLRNLDTDTKQSRAEIDDGDAAYGVVAVLNRHLAAQKHKSTKSTSAVNNHSASNDRISVESGNANGVPDLNTSTTLDLIITIVGEHFGQRDLLTQRLQW